MAFQWSTRSTAGLVSRHEIGLTHVYDDEVMAAFLIVGSPYDAAFVAWTTTPWSLRSNLALGVNASFVYLKGAAQVMKHLTEECSPPFLPWHFQMGDTKVACTVRL
ncbi:Aminoacyl-tRNA synthetase, class Ia [Corchorus capsularis]|uniref:Aminoacyl-tRNA synthetase, class Ia n=1 Tax=Corchorus capsularis TaxID=210143 RepID=A0A1R3H7E9_COCAP|nr:Aminoacyl-tRNA synthetase, class Ia [Corchorus capsularis]